MHYRMHVLHITLQLIQLLRYVAADEFVHYFHGSRADHLRRAFKSEGQNSAHAIDLSQLCLPGGFPEFPLTLGPGATSTCQI